MVDIKVGTRCAVALYLVVLLGVLSGWSAPRIHAQQPRAASEGVYTAVQATRGEAAYGMRCAACHGPMLEGIVGPPLAGQEFLGVWGPQTLSDLFDKIHNTMPADAPGSLMPAQVIDLVTYILQANKLPAGPTALAAASLKGLSFDSMQGGPLRAARLAATPATSAIGPNQTFPAVGTLNQVMRGILFPSSNVLFDVQTQDPGARSSGARPEAATTSARYGDVYQPWQVVDAAAIAIAEAAPLLLSPGRRCENGKPAPVDRADWQQYVRGLVDAGRAAYKASQTRNQETVSEVTNVISDACANCHRVYRDRPTAAERCTPP